VNDILEYLAKKLRDEQEVIKENLASGKVKDYAEYQQNCGVLRGLLIANNMIAEMAERLDHDE
jgi:hypothetical protein